MNEREWQNMAAARLMRERYSLSDFNLRGPLAGVFAAPCGAWLALNGRLAGMPWRRILRGASRRGVLGRAA